MATFVWHWCLPAGWSGRGKERKDTGNKTAWPTVAVTIWQGGLHRRPDGSHQAGFHPARAEPTCRGALFPFLPESSKQESPGDDSSLSCEPKNLEGIPGLRENRNHSGFGCQHVKAPEPPPCWSKSASSPIPAPSPKLLNPTAAVSMSLRPLLTQITQCGRGKKNSVRLLIELGESRSRNLSHGQGSMRAPRNPTDLDGGS